MSKLNHNRSLPTNRVLRADYYKTSGTKKGVVVLNYDSFFPYGKYKGKKVIDVLNTDEGYIKYVFREKFFLFSLEVGTEIKRRINLKYVDQDPAERQAIFDKINAERKERAETFKANKPKKVEPVIYLFGENKKELMSFKDKEEAMTFFKVSRDLINTYLRNETFIQYKYYISTNQYKFIF